MTETAKRSTLAALDRLDILDDTVSERTRLARLVAALCIEIVETLAECDEWRARAEAAEAKLAQIRGRA